MKAKSNFYKQIILKGPKYILEAVFLLGSETESHFTLKNQDFFQFHDFWANCSKGQPYFFILSLSLSKMFSDSRIHYICNFCFKIDTFFSF